MGESQQSARQRALPAGLGRPCRRRGVESGDGHGTEDHHPGTDSGLSSPGGMMWQQ